MNCATKSESPLSGSMVFKMRSFSGNSRTTNSVSPHVTYSIRASWINMYCACETSNNYVTEELKSKVHYVHNCGDPLIRWGLLILRLRDFHSYYDYQLSKPKRRFGDKVSALLKITVFSQATNLVFIGTNINSRASPVASPRISRDWCQ